MPTLDLAVGEFLTGQVVWTYTPDRWPAGLISGHVDAERHFWVRHVVTFRRGCLLPMLKAGIVAAYEQDLVALCISIPADFPPARPLLRVARMCGFTPYATGLNHSYHVVRWL